MAAIKQEILAELDVVKYWKIYKKMERDKHIQNIGSKFAKQTKVISILKKEDYNVLKDLNVATGSSNKKKNKVIWKRLIEILNEYDKINVDIKRERGHFHEIEAQIKRVKDNVVDLQAQQITDLQFQARILEGRKVVEKLENKLCTMTKAFCTVLILNRKLREEIEHYLQERTYFNRLWEEYIHRLKAGKKIMMDLIEQATIAYDQREEWVQNLTALRMKAQSEATAQINEVHELQTVIEHNKKLAEFLETKNQKRIMFDLEDKLMQKRRENKERIQRELREYRTMLAEIEELTGQSDMNEFARQFLIAENENFSKYVYANELTRDMEDMSTKLAHYRKKSDEERKQNDEQEAYQQQTLENLNNLLTTATEEADNADKQYEDTSARLKSLLNAIEMLFNICKASNAPILELLGNNTIITKYNVLLYLDVLEKRVSELLRKVYFKQAFDKRAKLHVIMDKLDKKDPISVLVYAHHSPCPLCMETAFCDDIIEKCQIPLPKPEITVKLNTYLAIPDAVDLVHNVSNCLLPKSREIIQRRYQ